MFSPPRVVCSMQALGEAGCALRGLGRETPGGERPGASRTPSSAARVDSGGDGANGVPGMDQRQGSRGPLRGAPPEGNPGVQGVPGRRTPSGRVRARRGDPWDGSKPRGRHAPSATGAGQGRPSGSEGRVVPRACPEGVALARLIASCAARVVVSSCLDQPGARAIFCFCFFQSNP